MKLHRSRTHDGAAPRLDAVVPILEFQDGDLRRLSRVFAPPTWLRDLGRAAWLLVGILLLTAGVIWLLGLTATIVQPVVVAAIIAVVASPVVAALTRHMPRAVAAILVLLSLIALVVLIAVLVISGIVGQAGAIGTYAASAANKAENWLTSVGVDQSGADSANANVSSSVPQIISTLTHGVISGIQGIASLVFGLALAALSTFFLLKDGPVIRNWVDAHLGLPRPVALTVTGRLIGSLRGYFHGVTIVAAFNGIVVLLGALVLGVPLAGTIGIVTFVMAYIPFIGAFVAGAFAVIIALGAKGVTAALLMLVIVLLANGLLQNILQPFAMGAALSLHPLVTLVVTIGAGCLFGTVGLILAAPLVSAAHHIAGDLGRARAIAPPEPELESSPSHEGAPARA